MYLDILVVCQSFCSEFMHHDYGFYWQSTVIEAHPLVVRERWGGSEEGEGMGGRRRNGREKKEWEGEEGMGGGRRNGRGKKEWEGEGMLALYD